MDTDNTTNVGAIRWKLRSIMKRHQIAGYELAEYLDVHPNTVSGWRNAEYFPAIDAKKWSQIAAAINALSKIEKVITPLDLIEYVASDNIMEDEDIAYNKRSQRIRTTKLTRKPRRQDVA
jgi:transcriptional regulator with XRE-family HTH domain